MSVIVKNITKLYGEQKALDNISFQVNKGEIVGFLGPNGAGKSTTMKILTCYIPQTSGNAEVCGFDVMSESMDVRRRVGYLPEQNPLYYDMYVKEYLMFMAGLRKLGKDSAKRVDEMIERTGLGKERKKSIHQLSKGFKQRVGLAQAMLHEPEVLILDEPTSGLDPNQILDIRQLIREIGKDKTVILSTHIMQEVEALCNRAIIINQGQIVANDTIEALQGRVGSSVRIVVEFRDIMMKERFKTIQNISHLEMISERKFAITGLEADKLKEDIFALAVSQQNTIKSMQEAEQKLESVFRDLTLNAGRNQKKK